jgi:hypothetical protein
MLTLKRKEEREMATLSHNRKILQKSPKSGKILKNLKSSRNVKDSPKNLP